MENKQKLLLYGGFLSALLLFLIGSRMIHPDIEPMTEPAFVVPMNVPIRPAPERFRADTNLPPRREGITSGSIDLTTFSPERDLMTIDDKRVWWESDNDTNDTENDHMINKALEGPLRRVIELVVQNNGTLEVHDAYRDTGIHNTKSLHKEGRAIDLTCDDFPLEKLAKLCWSAGFDWVLYEIKGGAHIHCSVKRDHSDQMIYEAFAQ
jgi:hypothetical protein